MTLDVCAWKKDNKNTSSSEDLGTFPFTNQKFGNFGNIGKWYSRLSDFRKSFQRFWKLFIFRNAKHSTSKILDIPLAKLNEKKTSDKKTFENLGIPREIVLCFGILANAIPFAMFATGNCLKFKPDVLGKWKFWQNCLWQDWSVYLMTPTLPSNRSNG